jgi:hypothetical protein
MTSPSEAPSVGAYVIAAIRATILAIDPGATSGWALCRGTRSRSHALKR